MVTPSMRRQTAHRKNRETKEKETRAKRNQAIKLLESKQSYRAVCRATSLPMGTIGRLKRMIENAEEEQVPYDDSLYDLRRGRKQVITFVEERAIGERLKECAEHGFPASREILKSIAADISNDGRKGFFHGYPSDDWIRGFRSRHRDITFRKMESREGAKIAAGNPDNVRTLVQALQLCEQMNPGILDDAGGILNMDETQVSINVLETEKGFVSAATNQGGQKMTCDSQGKHLTAVVIATAAGDVLLPFLIFAGSNNMQRWYKPLSANDFKDEAGVPHWLAMNDWMSGDAFVACSKNGSTTQELIPYVIDHITKITADRSDGKKLLLLVNGYKSRNGHLWLTKAKEQNIEVIQTPANTSHFLQACDQSMNKKFKHAIRKTFDTLSKKAFLDFGDMGVKLKLGVAGFRALTPEVVKKSFNSVGLWPMDYRFLKWAEEKWTGLKSPETEAKRRSMRVELQNQWKEMMKVVHQSGDLSFKIDKLENIITAGNNRVKCGTTRLRTMGRMPTHKRVFALRGLWFRL